MICNCMNRINNYIILINILKHIIFSSVSNVILKHECEFSLVRYTKCCDRVLIYLETIRALYKFSRQLGQNKTIKCLINDRDWMCVFRVHMHQNKSINENFGE